MVVVPGSTGVSAMAPVAALLASHGYVAGVLAHMQEPGLTSAFCEIPLEALDAGVRAFADRAEVGGEPIAVLAASVGTAAALSMLADQAAPVVAGVVAISPTHVVWQALGDGGPPPIASSLTRAGRGLSYVPMRDDQMWPSVAMAQALLARRRQHGGHPDDRVLVLPGAGHFLRLPITPTTVARNDALISGGSPAASARAQRAAWDETLAFLHAVLGAGA